MKKQLDRIEELESLIAKLPQGNITYKTIHGKKQPYLQWTEKGKTKSKYIKISERETVIEQVSLRRALQEELKTLKAETASLGLEVTSVSFETNVVIGRDLYAMIEGVRDWEKRDCFEQVQKYINGSGYGRVCLVYGLRRTGKTTMLLQALNEMSEEQFGKAAYIKARSSDTMAAMNRDLKKLQECGYKYIFVDEVTLMSFQYKGDFYNIIYGCGIDSSPKIWHKVKGRYLGKKVARKVDNLYRKLLGSEFR